MTYCSELVLSVLKYVNFSLHFKKFNAIYFTGLIYYLQLGIFPMMHTKTQICSNSFILSFCHSLSNYHYASRLSTLCTHNELGIPHPEPN